MLGLLAIIGLGTGDRFAENEVVVGRDADEIFFATCRGHVIHDVVVREGSSTEGAVVWSAKRTGDPGSFVVRTATPNEDYDIIGNGLSEIDRELSIASFKIDGGLTATS